MYSLPPSPQCLDEESLVLRLIVLNIRRSRVRSKVSQQFCLRYKYVSWYLTQLVSILFYFVRLRTICQRIKVFYNASKFAWYCTFVTIKQLARLNQLGKFTARLGFKQLTVFMLQIKRLRISES